MKKRKYFVTLVLLAAAVCLVIYGEATGLRKRSLDYASSLEAEAASVNGQSLTLRDLAYYVALVEAHVHKQALAYDPEDTAKYWNVHEHGLFIRATARNAAMQMAVHDVLFGEMAAADGIILDEEENAALSRAQENFWQDLEEDGKVERLGVSREDIYASMARAALAEKYQTIYEQMEGVPAGAYDYDGAAFADFMEKQDYRLEKKVWRRVNFGNVTLEHE